MSEDALRQTLAAQLRQSHGHVGLKRALEGLPPSEVGRKVEGHRHTAWEQLEHLRLAAEDLVSYCRDGDYEELGWPDGYWPASAEPASAEAWSASVEALLTATESMAEMVEDPQHDLYETVPTSSKRHHHTLRAALILLDHNAYHVGQLISLRIALGHWPPA